MLKLLTLEDTQTLPARHKQHETRWKPLAGNRSTHTHAAAEKEPLQVKESPLQLHANTCTCAQTEWFPNRKDPEGLGVMRCGAIAPVAWTYHMACVTTPGHAAREDPLDAQVLTLQGARQTPHTPAEGCQHSLQPTQQASDEHNPYSHKHTTTQHTTLPRYTRASRLRGWLPRGHSQILAAPEAPTTRCRRTQSEPSSH